MENEKEKKIDKVENICNIVMCTALILSVFSLVNIGDKYISEAYKKVLKNSDEITAKELEKIQTELDYYELKIEKLEKGE